MHPLLSQFGRSHGKNCKALRSRFSQYYLKLFQQKVKELSLTCEDAIEMSEFATFELRHLSAALAYSEDLDERTLTNFKAFSISSNSLRCFQPQEQPCVLSIMLSCSSAKQ